MTDNSTGDCTPGSSEARIPAPKKPPVSVPVMNSETLDLGEVVHRISAEDAIGEFTEEARRISESLQEVVTAFAAVPKIDLQRIIRPMQQMTESFARAFDPAAIQVIESLRSQFVSLADNLSRIRQSSYPPNWLGGDELLLPEGLGGMLLDEGLPLAWVPRRSVLEQVFLAESPGRRRSILSNNWQSIGTDCIQELESIVESELKQHVVFAQEAAGSLLEGRWRSSQALSANLLDTMLRDSFDEELRRALTNQTTRVAWEDYPIAEALVVGGIWGSHGTYFTHNGDSIPRRYSRHASVHGVSHYQYTRLNALVALMHNVGLLKFLQMRLAADEVSA